MWTRHFKRILRKLYEKAAVRVKILRRIRSSIDTSVQKRGGRSDHRFFSTDNFLQKKALCFVFDCRNGTACFPFKNYFRRLHHDAFNLQTIGKQQNCPRSNLIFCVSLFLFFRCLDSQFIAFKFKKTLMLEFYVGEPWTIITRDFIADLIGF